MFSKTILKSSGPLVGTVVAAGAVYALSSQLSSPLSTSQKVTGPQPSSSGSKPPTKVFTSGLTFQTLKLQSVEEVNHNTKRLRFELPNRDAVSGIQPISALLTKATPSNAWLPVLRPYSPISDPDEPGHIDFLVKHYENGSMSSHLHNLQPGQTLSFKTGPLQEFTWSPNKHSHIALITGGAGITPMYQLTRSIFKDPLDKTKVTLVFGVNSDQDVLFEREFRELERAFPQRFRVVYTVSNPVAGSNYRKGYVTRELLDETIPKPEEGIKVLFCGPPAMEKVLVGPKGWFGSQGTLGGVLQEMGYRQDQVFKL